MIKFVKKVSILIVVVAIFIGENADAVYAKSYNTWCERGVRYISWYKCSIDWSTNGDKILSYDADQQRSGILVNLKGCKKLSKSNDKIYYINSKTEWLAGAEIGGITLGYATTYIDQARIKRKGTFSWKLGI